MRSPSLFLLLAVSLAAALPAAAQTTPRRPPADTVRFGATRPSAGDSIRMAEYEEGAEEETDVARAEDSDEEAEADSVPRKPRSGPYTRAGGTGPFSVQASGETAARPPRGEVVWLEGRAAARDTAAARRDTARAGTGQRVTSGQTARRDTASASTTRPARRDTASTASRPAARDTAGARRTGQTATNQPARPATGTTGGRTGSTATTSTSGRTGSTSTGTTTTTGGGTGSTTPSASRARTHTVTAGETFFGIARRYGVTAAQLRAINPDVEMDALEVGDVLRLPASARDSRAGSGSTSGPGSAPRTGSQAAPRAGSQGTQGRRSHTVAAGETLFGIARRYGVTVDAIRQANDLEGDQLRTGQRLVIPPAR